MSIGLTETSFQSFDELTQCGAVSQQIFDKKPNTSIEREITPQDTNLTTGSAVSSLSATPEPISPR